MESGKINESVAAYQEAQLQKTKAVEVELAKVDHALIEKYYAARRNEEKKRDQISEAKFSRVCILLPGIACAVIFVSSLLPQKGFIPEIA